MNHAQQAEELLRVAVSDEYAASPEGYGASIFTAQLAQVHATLALAEQQRIANVIAWTTANGTEPTEETACKIAEALGLGDPA